MRSRDHPRSRGVYGAGHPATLDSMGSSPLARGLPRSRSRATGITGIIPARAGFTACNFAGLQAPPDHPRSRGVYIPGAEHVAHPPGSSPLARGLPHEASEDRGVVGIIPARAGFTAPGPMSRAASTDHPRSRGVYSLRVSSVSSCPGSSPLARGLPTAWSGTARNARIIPARAGFTRSHPQARHPHRDHPRSRGVYD